MGTSMEICQFSHVDTTICESRQIKGRDRQPPAVIRMPWCSHQGSPVTQEVAHVLGSGNRLKCEGDLGKCAIAP